MYRITSWQACKTVVLNDNTELILKVQTFPLNFWPKLSTNGQSWWLELIISNIRISNLTLMQQKDCTVNEVDN